MSALLPDLGTFYRKTGAALAGELRCERCGATRACTGRKATRYLQDGWPRCCGYTMTLVTERELAELAAGGAR